MIRARIYRTATAAVLLVCWRNHEWTLRLFDTNAPRTWGQTWSW